MDDLPPPIYYNLLISLFDLGSSTHPSHQGVDISSMGLGGNAIAGDTRPNKLD